MTRPSMTGHSFIATVGDMREAGQLTSVNW